MDFINKVAKIFAQENNISLDAVEVAELSDKIICSSGQRMRIVKKAQLNSNTAKVEYQHDTSTGQHFITGPNSGREIKGLIDFNNFTGLYDAYLIGGEFDNCSGSGKTPESAYDSLKIRVYQRRKTRQMAENYIKYYQVSGSVPEPTDKAIRIALKSVPGSDEPTIGQFPAIREEVAKILAKKKQQEESQNESWLRATDNPSTGEELDIARQDGIARMQDILGLDNPDNIDVELRKKINEG